MFICKNICKPVGDSLQIFLKIIITDTLTPLKILMHEAILSQRCFC